MIAFRLAIGLLLLNAVAAFVGPAWEARQRAPEQTVRAYLAAVEREDLTAALETIAPAERDALRDEVENQLGSRYRVDVLALGTPSFLSRALGAPPDPVRATILAVVTPASGPPWRSTSIARLVLQDGRWYLLNAPFT